jgi:transcription antitermination factor NusG
VNTVRQIPGVLRIVGRGVQYEPIPPNEIEALRQLVSLQPGLSPHRYLHAGAKVRIRGGALDGIEGILEQVGDGQRVVVCVHILRQAVSIHVNGYEIEPLKPPTATRVAINCGLAGQSVN